MVAVTGITHSMTAAPAFQVWLLPQWPKTVNGVYPVDEPIPLPGDVTQAITELTYTSRRKDLPGMDTFQMTVLNDSGRFTDTPWFQEGNLVDIRWGYAPDNMSARKVGIITAVNPRFPQRSAPMLTIKGNCWACAMAARNRYGVWRRVNWGELQRSAGSFADPGEDVVSTEPVLGYSPSEIAIILAEAYGLKAEVQYCDPIKDWCQCGESDWTFLKRLASEAIKVPRDQGDVGVQFWVDGDTLHFHTVTAKPEKDVVMTFAYYCDDTGMLKDLDLQHDTQLDQGEGVEVTVAGLDPRRMDVRGFTALNRTVADRVALGSRTSLEPGAAGTRGQKNQIVVEKMTHEIPPALAETHTAVDETSTDPLKKSIVTGSGRMTPATSTEVKGDPDPTKREASDTYSRATAREIKGTAVTVGWPTLEAGKLINIQCLGAKYGGLYAIDQAVHSIARAGGKTAYECVLEISRSAKGEDDGKYDAKVNPKADIVDKPAEKIGPEKIEPSTHEIPVVALPIIPPPR